MHQKSRQNNKSIQSRQRREENEDFHTVGTGGAWGTVGGWVAWYGVWGLFDDAAVIRGGRAGAGVGGGSHRGGRDDGGVGYLARLLRERGLVEDRLDGGAWGHWGVPRGFRAR